MASEEWIECTQVTLIYGPLPEMQFQIPRTVTHLWSRDLFYLLHLRKYFINFKNKISHSENKSLFTFSFCIHVT